MTNIFGDTFSQIISVLAAIVGVAGVAVVVGSKNTSGIIDSLAGGFSNSLKAAMG